MEVVKNIVVAVIYFFLEALMCWGLWNAIIPQVIGWSEITYWQMIGLMLIVRLIPRKHKTDSDKINIKI